jgi:hypothetical protein
MKTKCDICNRELHYYRKDEVEKVFYLITKSFCCGKKYRTISPTPFCVIFIMIPGMFFIVTTICILFNR